MITSFFPTQITISMLDQPINCSHYDIQFFSLKIKLIRNNCVSLDISKCLPDSLRNLNKNTNGYI